jgi:RNA polymerase sigma-70 factor (ECF subfamily)
MSDPSTTSDTKDMSDTEQLTTFARHRDRLFGIAYRMLASVADAEDVVQDAYLRWHRADPSAVRNAEAWLVTVTTRLAIDRLRTAVVEREHYVGAWLPEPIATSAASAPDRNAELASDLSMAFLVLLERLAPEERAALLLRDVFDCGYDEVAHVLDKSESACRQIVHRARTRVRGERARFVVPAETTERLLEKFLAALRADDRDAMLALLAEDAKFVADGGGKVLAIRNVLHGALKIARFLLGIEGKWGRATRHEVQWINGEPAIVTSFGEQLHSTTSVESDGERITAFYRVLNPEKLRHVAPTTVERLRE